MSLHITENPFYQVTNDKPFTHDMFITHDYTYECTVTFDKGKIWDMGSIWNEGLNAVVQETSKWLYFLDDKKSGHDVKQILFVVEYQKNLTPHIHMRITSASPVPYWKRANIVAGLFRMFGRSTFKPVRLEENYQDYISKDLNANYEKYGFHHYLLCNQK